MKKIKFLVVIPARKNSKRLKNKNLLKINGKNLIEITVNFALKLKLIQHILVSTDIKNLKKKLTRGDKVLIPWIRPKKLSQDKSPTTEVLIHAIKWYEKKFEKINYIILLQTTSPIRSLKLVNKAINTFLKSKKSTLIVKKIKSKIKGKQYITKKNKIYYPTGSLYIFTKEKLMKKKIYDNNSEILIDNNYYRNIDIDHKEDFIKAKKFLEKI